VLPNLGEETAQSGWTTAIAEPERLTVKNWKCLIVYLLANTEKVGTDVHLIHRPVPAIRFADGYVSTILLDGVREFETSSRRKSEAIDAIPELGRQLEEWERLTCLQS
jgi:hypothetical protein